MMVASPVLAKLTATLPFLGILRHVRAQPCWQDTPCSDTTTAAFLGPWDANNFAPESRTVSPVKLLDLASGEELGSWPITFTLASSQPGVYLDFGKEVGGVVTVDFEVMSVTGEGSLGLAFTEARNWVGRNSDSSNGDDERPDGAIYANFSSTGNYTYTMPNENLRGGFRHMTLFLLGDDTSVTVDDISLEISFQPTWSNLRAYQGYFHCDDDLLNKIWYSGAYTLQTDAIRPDTGRAWPAPDWAWSNTGDLGPGATINTDGAKRDRTVWPGDMGVATPASFYSTGDLESVKNSLQTLYTNQAASGLLPFSGPPLNASNSDTYHMWIMIGTYNYVLYSGDLTFLQSVWPGYLKAMSFLSTQFDVSVDLINIINYANDWGRLNSNGTLAAAQMLGYRALVTGAALADWVGDSIGSSWLEAAAGLLNSTNDKLWDEGFGAFKDNYGVFDTDLHPQDGNSLAVLFSLVDASSSKAQDISTYLASNWMSLGAESPELPGEISPFMSSFEIQAHILAGQSQRALDLIRVSWGWYLANTNGTQSTMIEGYLTDGTFGYRHDAGYDENYSYTSHAHGWSTGPVTALTEGILGLSVTGLAGETWRLAPQFGDLTHVEGGFTTRLGHYSASWTRYENGSCEVVYEVPAQTSGEILLPGAATAQVTIDEDFAKSNAVSLVEGSGGRQLFSLHGDGGRHTILVI
ncbi:alpha-L-rhamnosidase B [Xylariaceae sp. FL0016]|nr:alpha-L-rhamnosidase B [Xylariaceae sp. FL0016]